MNNKTERARLQRTLDRLVEDIMLKSDEDLLAELSSSGENPSELEARATTAINAAVKRAGRERLAAARSQIARRHGSSIPDVGLNLGNARLIYSRVRMRKSTASETLAARNGSELSDQQMLDILKDLLALGAISPKDLEG
jgi:hypothetical protein